MPDNDDYYKVCNRGTLKKLASGMEITRATKHEPINFAGLSDDVLQRSTDDRNGSKFLPEWTLDKLVGWLEQKATENNWKFPPGAKTRLRVLMNDNVGYVSGRLVSTITVTVSGRWMHAYPDED